MLSDKDFQCNRAVRDAKERRRHLFNGQHNIGIELHPLKKKRRETSRWCNNVIVVKFAFSLEEKGFSEPDCDHWRRFLKKNEKVFVLPREDRPNCESRWRPVPALAHSKRECSDVRLSQTFSDMKSTCTRRGTLEKITQRKKTLETEQWKTIKW